MSQIQWFPGHMQKALRIVEEKMKLVDVVIEVCDARIPISSRNPELQKRIGEKAHVLLYTKRDLADEKMIAKWSSFYKEQGKEALFVNTKQLSSKEIENACFRVLEAKHARMKARGMKIPAIRAMIIGMPNVGKSTLINKLSGRRAANVGNRPGVTKSEQWIKIGKQFELLDTPGIMWPKIDDILIAYKIAATGAIKDTTLPLDDVCKYIFDCLKKAKKVQKIGDAIELADDYPSFMNDFVARRGFTLPNDEWDYTRGIETFLHEFRSGDYGRFVLDEVK